MNLPAINSAILPPSYEDACTAIAKCDKLDECKDWADKAMAMASYAKQAKDDYLMNKAIKIKARAIRQCGKLLEQVKPMAGKRTDLQPANGAGIRLSISEVAENAGMSTRQKNDALNVANIPEEKFNHMVEDEHATITALAKAGREALTSKKPEGFKQATMAIGYLRRMATGSEEHDVNIFKGGMREKEIQEMKERAIFMIAWLNDLLTDLECKDEN